jgi:hypothetical protein
MDGAEIVAKYLDCFDAVIATTLEKNTIGRAKAEAIQDHAQGPFAYIGDHRMDLAIWRVAKECLLAVRTSNQKQYLTRKLGKAFTQYFEADKKESSLFTVARALRLHQWSKNLLLFVPAILAHRWHEAFIWQRTVIAFITFGLAASSIYVLNDLLDLSADRRHPRKRFRPFAADLDTHTVGRDMIELAQEGSEEGFHFVCGAVWALERVASQLAEASRRDILAALYEDQGLDRLEAPSDIQ